jgi:hypothetical protein
MRAGQASRLWRARTLVVAGLGALVAVLGLLAARDLHHIQRELDAGRTALDGFSLDAAGDLGLRAVAEDASRHLTSASDRAHRSVALSLLGRLPVLDDQVGAIRRMTAATEQLGTSAARAAERMDAELDRADEPAGRIALLDVAIEEMDRIDAELARVDLGRPDGLVGPLRTAHEELARAIRSAHTKLTHSRQLAEPIRDLLQGPSTFMLLAANNAEMAGGAGLALSAGILTFDQGEITLGEVVPARELRLPDAVSLPGALGAIYGPTGVGLDLRSTTRSPNLPLMGPVVADIMAAHGLADLDGVLVVDAVALADVMAISGPVEVDGTTIDAEGVVAQVLHEGYRHFDLTSDQEGRVDQQGEIAKAVFESLTTRQVPAIALASALLDASAGRHLMLWSEASPLQDAWADLGIAGALPRDGLLVAFQNYGADKMDWYLRPSATLDVRLLPSGDYRARLRMSVRVPAAAEITDASPYILGPDPGGHGVFLTVHLPEAARDITTTDPGGFSTKGVDPPLQVRTFLADVPLGETFERTVDFTLPRSLSAMTLVPSARLEPMPLTIDGVVTVDDGTIRRVTWSEALPLPAPDDGAPAWLLPAGLTALALAGASALIAARRRS